MHGRQFKGECDKIRFDLEASPGLQANDNACGPVTVGDHPLCSCTWDTAGQVLVCCGEAGAGLREFGALLTEVANVGGAPVWAGKVCSMLDTLSLRCHVDEQVAGGPRKKTGLAVGLVRAGLAHVPGHGTRRCVQTGWSFSFPGRSLMLETFSEVGC